MSQFKGVNTTFIRSQVEPSYGTEPTTVTGTQLPFNSCTLKSTRNLNTSETITGRRDATQGFYGYTDVGGDIVGPVDQDAMGYILQMMFGDPVTTGGPTYVHTYKVPDCLPSYACEVGYTDACGGLTSRYFKYSGVKASSMALSFGGDGELIYTLSLVGKGETTGTTSMDAAPVDVTGITRFNNFEATVEEGGSSVGDVKELDMTITNGLDTDAYVLGAASTRGDLPEGICSVEGRMLVLFSDLSYYTKAVNGTESSIKLLLTSGSYSLEFMINELNYQQNAPDVDTPGGIYMEMNFVAYFNDHADDSIIKAILTNGTSAYV